MSDPAGAPVVIPPSRRCRVPVPAGSDFPFANLPYGVVRRPGQPDATVVRVGDTVVDLGVLATAGVLDGVPDAPALFAEARGGGGLDRLLAAGRPAWTALRRRLTALLDAADGTLDALPRVADRAVRPLAGAEPVLPFTVGDVVDHYASREHAEALARILRPGEPPLPASWRHLPVGYHGRARAVVVSGTPVHRPVGQYVPDGGSAPVLAPTARLDLESELGFVTGPGVGPGTRITVADAPAHVFGAVLVNDWSARDLQAWEYRPLGPFTAKSFATSISPWVVPLDALEPCRVPGPVQDPPVLPYLRATGPWHLAVDLDVRIASAAQRARGEPPASLTRASTADLYWSLAQMLAHTTVAGAPVGPGDLFATGTVSGAGPGAAGSLIELTEDGRRPFPLDGASRTYLEDGDTVEIAGVALTPDGARIGFGAVTGTVLPARTV